MGSTATLLFTDLVGSTELLDELGDTEAEEVRRAHFRLLREVLAAHDGREVKSLGDGLMITFPTVVNSLTCAAQMQHLVESRNRERSHRPLHLRIGINVGEVISEDNDFFGRPVVVAKRLCDRAEPGQVMVSDVAVSVVGTNGEYLFRPVGWIPLKGLADPVNTWELLWAPEGSPAIVEPDEASAEQGRSASDAPVPLPRGLETAGGGDFVGRALPLGQLSAHLDHARAGERRLVMLTGEPGIGKTRLCAELAREAIDEGETVLYGRCDEEALVPFQPFVEALRHYVGQCSPAMLRPQLEHIGEELSRFLPELERRVPRLSAPRPADRDVERLRLFEAVDVFLSTMAERAPVVLVLDDLHWADKPTLLMLGHILRSPKSVRLLIVGTYRDTDVTLGHPLDELLADLRRSDPIDGIRLEGLSQAEVGALISSWAGPAAPPGLAEALWHETEGHPFFAREMLRHLLETGALRELGGRLTVSRSIAALGIPQGVKELVERRLARLDRRAYRLLTMASVVGREFPLDLLERVWQGPRDEVYELLEDAAAAEVIGELAASDASYAFSHALIREVLYDGLFAVRRADFHQRIGEAFEAMAGRQGDRFLAERAHHFFEAASSQAAATDLIEKAIWCGTAAAELATEQLAYEDAVQHYEHVLTALALVGPHDSRRCELLLRYGDSQWRAGEFVGARQAFLEAAELGDQEQLVRAALGYAGPSGFGAGLVDATLIELLERALKGMPAAETAQRTRVLGRLAEALSFSEARPRGRELAEQALAAARRLGDKLAVAEVLSNAMWPLWTPDNLEWRLAAATEIAELARETGAVKMLWEGQSWRVGHLMELADIAAVDAELEACRRLAEQVREPAYLAFATMLAAMRTLLVGDLEEAERLAWKALEIGHEGENTSLVQLFGVQMFHLRLLQGRLGELHAATLGMTQQFSAVAATRCSLAALYCEAGRPDEARAEFETLAVEDFRWIPRDIFWLSCMDHLAEVCAHLEDESRAAPLYQLLLPYGDRYIVNGEFAVPRGFASRHLGLLAGTMGRFDDAVAHFEKALESNARVGPPYALILTQLNYARLLLTRQQGGDRDLALNLLDTAFRDSTLRRYPGLTEKIGALKREVEAGAAIVPRRRRTLGERASHVAGDARAALSTRGRAALGKLFGGAPDEALERRFGSHVAQRALFGAMAKSFQPRAAYGFEGEIAFELSHFREEGAERPPPPDHWTIRIKGSRAFARRRTAEEPAVSVRIGIPDFVRLFSGELNPVAVWVDRRGRVDGDITLGARLVEMFGGVVPFEVVPPEEQTHLPRRVRSRATAAGDPS